jgi:hypothetical protein
MSFILSTHGYIAETHPKNGSHFQLEELQEIVGGYIEIVHPGSFDMRGILDLDEPTRFSGKLLVINEEGKNKGLPLNIRATVIWGNPNDYIVGDVLFCDEGEVE